MRTEKAFAHFLLARAGLPRLPVGGALVFLSSTAAVRPSTRIPSYTASKAALSGLCRHVALEGAPRGVRANIVMPGYIDTPLGRMAAAIRPELDGMPPLQGRAGTAWEVAYAVVFLLSNEASYITGQELVVDGALIYQTE